MANSKAQKIKAESAPAAIVGGRRVVKKKTTTSGSKGKKVSKPALMEYVEGSAIQSSKKLIPLNKKKTAPKPTPGTQKQSIGKTRANAVKNVGQPRKKNH